MSRSFPINAYNCINNVVSGLNGLRSLSQSQTIHAAEISHASKKHKNSLTLATSLHEEDLLNTRKTYLLELYYSLEQHFQQLNADLISNMRESERDMFDQRNQIMQTIILGSSVMLTSLCSVIVEGLIPPKATSKVFNSFAFFCCISFAFLFVAIIISREVMKRSSNYMKNRSRDHSQKLKGALEETVLHSLSEAKVEHSWNVHEGEVKKFLERREQINARAVIQLVREPFEDFWNEKCGLLSRSAIYSFFSGTVTLLVAILIFMWATYSITYDNVPAAVISIGIILFSIVVSGLAWMIFVSTDDADSIQTKQTDKDSKGTKTMVGEEEEAIVNTEEVVGESNRVAGLDSRDDMERNPVFCAPANMV